MSQGEPKKTEKAQEPASSTTNTQISSGSGSDGVKQAVVDGVKLGMAGEEALALLKSNGYELDKCASPENSANEPCSSSKLGVTVQGTKSQGYEKVTIRTMNNQVYWFSKRITYIPGRNLPDGQSTSDLQEDYYDKYSEVFSTRYFDQYGSQPTYHFDDESPPPYNRKLTSPHATLSLNGRRGTLIVGIDMEWKGLVGAAW
jgi:hypothetical protein